MKRLCFMLVLIIGLMLMIASCSVKKTPEMVFVEGGSFSPDDGSYNVTLSSFYIGKYEVTQSEWTSVMDGIQDPNWSDWGKGPNHPAYRISWFDAIEYCNRLSIRERLTPVYSYLDYGTDPDNWPAGWNTDRDNHTNVSCNWEANGYRLPTEMEYEFAARGGVPAKNAGTFNDRWAGTDVEAELGEYAWFLRNSGDEWLDEDMDKNRDEDWIIENNCRTHPVGTRLPNELGLYDMSGNVFNWVWDIRADYPTDSNYNPTGPETGDKRVLRGGSWYSNVSNCRSDYRGEWDTTGSYSNFGFRVSRALD